MKYALLSLMVIAGSFAFTGTASANVVCGNPANNTEETQYVACDNGNPANTVTVWGRNGDVPHMVPGAIIVDRWGFKSTCPIFFSNPCVDISNTSYYVNAMSKIFGVR